MKPELSVEKTDKYKITRKSVDIIRIKTFKYKNASNNKF